MSSIKPILFALSGALALSGATAGIAGHDRQATADLVDAQGQTRGKAIVTQGTDGLHVEVLGVGLPAGGHAVHIHAVGTCTGPDFASAGGHWNPGHKQHGHDNPMGAHKGDMPNMAVASDGTGTLKAIVEGAALTGGNDPLLDADGAAVVIHAAADDYKTDPTGNAGGRLACGVVKAP